MCAATLKFNFFKLKVVCNDKQGGQEDDNRWVLVSDHGVRGLSVILSFRRP
jgi:hypothetical protein